eukprot:CAMPEP_0175956486 /NCGR_PEP_ID=MMETSP0108-20121206/33106_1 /TAXON_ID=195067 ORGANISM="Goniomonas pacifica, Strain CCMP1869" /NCGR_SAMPLE_ID=MMETSP0108 /ASSEMBLY_ACC=CAM_ASM_000204 /LENGTH=121 /DNA_ID=CAMNT_0017283509 /DNA_START=84 /DNA_END=446 /DNA_ORIENTATION=+
MSAKSVAKTSQPDQPSHQGVQEHSWTNNLTVTLGPKSLSAHFLYTPGERMGNGVANDSSPEGGGSEFGGNAAWTPYFSVSVTSSKCASHLTVPVPRSGSWGGVTTTMGGIADDSGGCVRNR